MTNPIRRRLDALKAAATQPIGRCHVLTYGQHETPVDALLRAPGPGGYLIVGAVLPPEVWCPLAREQQEWMISRGDETASGRSSLEDLEQQTIGQGVSGVLSGPKSGRLGAWHNDFDPQRSRISRPDFLAHNTPCPPCKMTT